MEHEASSGARCGLGVLASAEFPSGWPLVRSAAAVSGMTFLVPEEMEPSAWMWFRPWDPRLHECFSRWLRRNYARMENRERWTAYECEHVRMW